MFVHSLASLISTDDLSLTTPMSLTLLSTSLRKTSHGPGPTLIMLPSMPSNPFSSRNPSSNSPIPLVPLLSPLTLPNMLQVPSSSRRMLMAIGIHALTSPNPSLPLNVIMISMIRNSWPLFVLSKLGATTYMVPRFPSKFSPIIRTLHSSVPPNSSTTVKLVGSLTLRTLTSNLPMSLVPISLDRCPFLLPRPPPSLQYRQ